jgi:Sulfotransferase domain
MRKSNEREMIISWHSRLSTQRLMSPHLQAITDIPCILFADELMAAYPNAKVVLNTRDPDKWLASMEKTFYVLISWKSMDFLGPWDPVRVTHKRALWVPPFPS